MLILYAAVYSHTDLIIAINMLSLTLLWVNAFATARLSHQIRTVASAHFLAQHLLANKYWQPQSGQYNPIISVHQEYYRYKPHCHIWHLLQTGMQQHELFWNN